MNNTCKFVMLAVGNNSGTSMHECVPKNQHVNQDKMSFLLEQVILEN